MRAHRYSITQDLYLSENLEHREVQCSKLSSDMEHCPFGKTFVISCSLSALAFYGKFGLHQKSMSLPKIRILSDFLYSLVVGAFLIKKNKNKLRIGGVNLCSLPYSSCVDNKKICKLWRYYDRPQDFFLPLEKNHNFSVLFL